MQQLAAVYVLLTLGGVNLFAQSTRVESIEEARRQKAQKLHPARTPTAKRVLNWMKDYYVLERFTYGINGVRLAFGGGSTPSGFALGPEYYRPDLLRENLALRAFALGSFAGYQLYGVELAAPKLAGKLVSLNFRSAYENSPRTDYYGPGPDSQRSGRTNYRQEFTTIDFLPAFSPVRGLRFGPTVGYLFTNVGPGQNSAVASTQDVFTPETTPGLLQQPNFLRAGFFAQYDYRDLERGPRRGGNYLAEFQYFGDREFDRFTFRRLDLELQQYFPFFNDRRVLALRGRTELTFTNPGQQVPFFLQPKLGGPDYLRGFRFFRFYGDHSLLLTAEYRWEVFSGLDAALFVDGGKVFDRRSQLNFHDLEVSPGFGLRFNARNKVFLRTDVGFSHEGFQVWVRFSNIF